MSDELERLLEQLHRLGEAAVDVAQLAEQPQRCAARGRIVGVGEHPLGERSGASQITGAEVALGGRERARESLRTIARGRQPRPELEQLRGRIRGATRDRPLGGPVQLERDPLVRLPRAERQVPCALLGLVDDSSQPPV